jgi:hypothetical protein
MAAVAGGDQPDGEAMPDIALLSLAAVAPKNFSRMKKFLSGARDGARVK